MRTQLAHPGRPGKAHNEVSVLASFWNSHLPHIIEAIAWFGNGEGTARDVHAKFIARFGLTSHQTPLLRFVSGDEGFVEMPTSQ